MQRKFSIGELGPQLRKWRRIVEWLVPLARLGQKRACPPRTWFFSSVSLRRYSMTNAFALVNVSFH